MAEAATEAARWRDVDRLLSRHGNLVSAGFDPRPTVSSLSLSPLPLISNLGFRVVKAVNQIGAGLCFKDFRVNGP